MSLFSSFFDIQDFPFSNMLSGKELFPDILDIFASFLDCYNFKGIEGFVEDNVTLKNIEKVEIHPEAVVESGAYVCGPCILSKNCIVRHGAYIRGNVFVGEGSIIGHCTEVKNSIFLSSAKAAHFAYVSDSILGKNVNLGAGVRCANLRLDRKTIKICTDFGVVDSYKIKLGACLGNEAQIGCNVVLNPGTLVKKRGLVFPGEVKSGLVN